MALWGTARETSTWRGRVASRTSLAQLLVGTLAAAVLLAAVAAAALLPTDRQVTALGERTGFSPGAGIMLADPADMERELDAVVDAGARWVRLDVDWSRVESTRGSYDWTHVDRVIDAARDRDIEVLALLAYTPAWARPAGTSTHAPPDDPSTFAAFAEAAAERYRPRGVHTYEIWNEPNLPQFWEPRPDASAYLLLLAAASAAVHRAAPDATVLSGGLAPASDGERGGEVDPRTFLRQLYDLGAAPLTDGVAVHPYSFPATPLQEGTGEWNTFQKLPDLRAMMLEYGDRDARLWLTEIGAPTGEGSGAVDEQRQADIVLQAVKHAAETRWTGPVFVYAIRDAGTDLDDREDNFGLLDRGFSPKPAFLHLRQALRDGPANAG